jgi:hypothetical protein
VCPCRNDNGCQAYTRRKAREEKAAVEVEAEEVGVEAEEVEVEAEEVEAAAEVEVEAEEVEVEVGEGEAAEVEVEVGEGEAAEVEVEAEEVEAAAEAGGEGARAKGEGNAEISLRSWGKCTPSSCCQRGKNYMMHQL